MLRIDRNRGREDTKWGNETREKRKRTYRMGEDFPDVPVTPCVGKEDGLIRMLFESPFEWLPTADTM